MRPTIVLMMLLVVVKVECQELNETQIQALRSAMNLVLNVRQQAPRGARRTAPKHLMDMMANIGAGEVVRTIEPDKDFVPHMKDVLVYNLTALRKPDKMRTAQLHIFRRRLLPQKARSKKRLLPPPCRVRLYQIQTPIDLTEESKEAERMKLRSLDTIPVPQGTKGGWFTIDISMALKEMLNSMAATNSLVFGVRFEGPRGKSINPQRFLKQPEVNGSSSFVIVFSDDTSKEALSAESVDIESNQIDIMAELLENAALAAMKNSKKNQRKRKTKKTERMGLEVESIRHGRKYYGNFDHKEQQHRQESRKRIEPGNGDIVELMDFDRVRKIKATRRHNHNTIAGLSLRYDTATKSVVPKKVARYDEDEESTKNDTETPTRKGRSIHDNELSDYVIEFSEDDLQTTTPDSEADTEDDMGDVYYYESNAALGDDDDYYRDRKTSDYETKYERKRKQDKRRHGRRGKKNKEPKGKSECHLSHLKINFDKIGMGYNILAPQELDVGFCSGRCSTPYKDDYMGTCNSTMKNYELLRSVLKLVHKHKGIPDSCCVPAKTSSIDMLRLDEYGNIYLAKYQDAMVESCECR